MKNDESETDSVSAIAVVASIFALILISVIFIAFIAPPISHYAGMWSEYWNTPSLTTESHFEPSPDQKRYNEASKDCDDKAQKQLDAGEDQIATTVVSHDEYKTYKCYAVKLQEIH